MNRDARIRILLLLGAGMVATVALLLVYFVEPIRVYHVVPAASSMILTEPEIPVSSGEVVSSAEVEVPVTSAKEEAETSTPLPDSQTESSGPQEVLVEKGINLNTATLEELDLLPGVGPAIAQRIVEYREANDGFYDIEEILDVSGIGEKTFEKLKPYITVE